MTNDPLRKPRRSNPRGVLVPAIAVLAGIELLAGLVVVLTPSPPPSAKTELFDAFERTKSYRMTGSVSQVSPKERWLTKVSGTVDERSDTSLETNKIATSRIPKGRTITQTTLSIGDSHYIRADPMVRQGYGVPANKEWLRIDYGEFAEQIEKRTESIDQEKIFIDVRYVGASSKGSARHIRARIDFDYYFQALAGKEQSDQERPKVGSLNVVINRRGYVARVQMRIESDTSDGRTVMTCTQTYSDQGERFTVAAPKVEEVFVYDISETFERVQDPGAPSQQPAMSPTYQQASVLSTGILALL